PRDFRSRRQGTHRARAGQALRRRRPSSTRRSVGRYGSAAARATRRARTRASAVQPSSCSAARPRRKERDIAARLQCSPSVPPCHLLDTTRNGRRDFVMKILFLTHNFPPETNALASRTYEHAKLWVKMGHQVEVVTCAPNHPKGRLYPGFRNALF